MLTQEPTASAHVARSPEIVNHNDPRTVIVEAVRYPPNIKGPIFPEKFKGHLVDFIKPNPVLLHVPNGSQKGTREELNAAKATVTTFSPAEATQRVDADSKLLMVDVREPAEYDAGACAGAVNIPRGMLEFQIATACPQPDLPILLY